MNIDVNSNTSNKKVTSKYFSCDPMDESLSDFQEKKKSCSGPKSLKANINKPKKAPKKPKGQRDIRAALKSKKNDLVAYTEKFDAVCKKAGVDVDTEELQLAIALSKSLETEIPDTDNCSTGTSSQERIKKIRKTLQEYGFKVPETKITTNKKIKKRKKDYRLISITDAEKEQIISNKYSHILFNSVDELNVRDTHLQDPKCTLFNLTTNVSYKDIKSSDIFYIDNLIDKSSSNGCLLKDWTKIPGRPASPLLFENIKMNFSEIECSQEELDSILSGPFKKIKKMLILKGTENQELHTAPNSEDISEKLVDNIENPDIIIEINVDKTKTEKINLTPEVAIHRSCSPDIFEDEDSVIEIISTNNTAQEQPNDAMDLTECVSNIPLKNPHNIFATTSCNFNISQNKPSNVTKRKSNDFMEITECVATSSQPIIVNLDITENHNDNQTVIKEKKVTLDLTQSSNSLDDLPDIESGLHQNLEDTIILSADDYVGITSKRHHVSMKSNSDVVCDLTQNDAFETEQIIQSFRAQIQQARLSSNNDINKDIIHFSTNELPENSTHNNRKDITLRQAASTSHSTKINSQTETKDHTKDFKECRNINFKPFNVNTNDQTNTKYVELSEDLAKKHNIDLTRSKKIDDICKYSSLEHLRDKTSDSDETIILPSNIDKCNKDSSQNQLNHLQIKDISQDFDGEKSLDEGNDIKIYDKVDLTDSPNSSIESMTLANYNNSCEHSFNNSNDSDKTQFLEEYNGKEAKLQAQLNNKEPTVKLSNNIDLTLSSNSRTEMDGACETNCFYNSPNNSNDTDETVLLPLEGDNKESSCQNKCNNLRIKNDVSKKYDDDHIKNIDKIDLTQSPNSQIEEEGGVLETYSFEHSPNNSNGSDKTIIIPIEEYKCQEIDLKNDGDNLGNRDISIDYDEVIDVNDYNNTTNFASQIRIKSNEVKDTLETSQQSEVFEIVDNELDYSLHKSRRENFNFGGLSILDEIPNPSYGNSFNLEYLEKSFPLAELNDNDNDLRRSPTPNKNNIGRTPKTPENNDYIIKFDNVTPMPNYGAMTSPERIKEMEKYGLKSFKRKRAIQLLTHIYNQTHPIIESIDDLPCPSKRFKPNETPPIVPSKIVLESPKHNLETLERTINIYEVTNEMPEIKEIECPVEDWVFQKREKSKVHSCRVPLHIAFHNYVSCRRQLRAAILRYEPIEIDVIHKQLVGYGHRYDPKELLKFMDKKCITVKTADNTKNNKD